MLITVFLHIWPKGHWEPRNEVESLSADERLGEFETGTFRFWLQHLNPLGHLLLSTFIFAVLYDFIQTKINNMYL